MRNRRPSAGGFLLCAGPVCFAPFACASGRSSHAWPHLVPAVGVDARRGRCRRESRSAFRRSRRKDLRLYYYDSLSYLEPHALRTFSNSLAWQKRTFGWVPYERTTVFLKDFSDYGNASASAAPVNLLTIDIAPLSLAFETFPASERMYTLMNHELVHVANGHGAPGPIGSGAPSSSGSSSRSGDPETLLYSYLTVPRFFVPRWYLEGSAAFLDTWMAGGQGRAQGGYDEMVFRAMVRDGARFYDPLASRPKG